MNNELQWPSHLIQLFENTPYIREWQHEIIEMIREAFNSLKNGQFRSSIIVAGEAMHRINCVLLAEFIINREIPQSTKLNKLQLDSKNDYEITEKLIHNLSLQESTDLLLKLNLIDDKLHQNMTILRHLRNKATHSWKPSAHHYDLTLSELGTTVRDVMHTPDALWPLSWIRYEVIININGKEAPFIIDPNQLMIDLRGVSHEKHVPIVSLAILFLTLKNAVKHLNHLQL